VALALQPESQVGTSGSTPHDAGGASDNRGVTAWATVTVVLVSSAITGVAASLITTRMRINYDREESLRTRMLSAADDFSLRATQAANVLYRAVHLVAPEDLLDEEGNYEPDEAARLRDAAEEVRPVIDETRVYLPRVQLLFGLRSPAGTAALQLMGNLGHVAQVLEDEPDVDYMRGVFDKATEANAVFMREARRALVRPSLSDRDVSPAPPTPAPPLNHHEPPHPPRSDNDDPPF
jgi:hypothetical protein